jgi:hypothetical protein
VSVQNRRAAKIVREPVLSRAQGRAVAAGELKLQILDLMSEDMLPSETVNLAVLRVAIGQSVHPPYIQRIIRFLNASGILFLNMVMGWKGMAFPSEGLHVFVKPANLPPLGNGLMIATRHPG